MDNGAGFEYPKVVQVNDVDTHVFAKLRRLNMVPSDLSSDTEFLRRVTIDTIGCLPTPDERYASIFLSIKRWSIRSIQLRRKEDSRVRPFSLRLRERRLAADSFSGHATGLGTSD